MLASSRPIGFRMFNLLHTYVFLQVKRQSLPAPPPCDVTFDEYINSDSYVHLGRPIVYKESAKNFDATVAMVFHCMHTASCIKFFHIIL